MIKVLIVEDSSVAQALLSHILDSDPDIQVVGTAGDGLEGLKLLNFVKPDVITMDMHMPNMDGYEATRRIMEKHPVPVVIVSASYKPGDTGRAFRALEAGAVAIVEKPAGPGGPGFGEIAGKFVETVKMMSKVKVARRLSHARLQCHNPTVQRVKPDRNRGAIKCVAIGASTGGPPAIRAILSGLPENFAVPVLVVQHIAAGFIKGMVEWVGQSTPLPVRLAANGEGCLPGHVYFAPDGFQMGIDSAGRITLARERPDNGLCPSVSHLFRSVAGAMGQEAVGVLLTGMGSDGAAGLKLMREKGAVTIAQDRESSVVYGMPGEAVKLDAAAYVLPPERIAEVLKGLVYKK